KSGRRALLVSLPSAPLLGVHHAQGGTPPLPPPFWWLCTWKFDDTNFFRYPAYPPRNSFGVQSVASFSGNAVDVSGVPALLSYNEIEADNTTNFVCGTGMFEFWVRPHWASATNGGTGPGTYARFIELGALSTN